MAEQISGLVGGLPMAIRLAGQYMQANEMDVGDYLGWLEQTPLAALDQGKRRMDSVPVLLGRSLAAVSREAAEALGVVGLLALAPFERGAVAEALEIDQAEAGRRLGELARYGVLRRLNGAYQVTHALVHTYARTEVKPPQDSLVRLGGYFDRFARAEEKRDQLAIPASTRLACISWRCCEGWWRQRAGRLANRWPGRWMVIWTSRVTGRNGCKSARSPVRQRKAYRIDGKKVSGWLEWGWPTPTWGSRGGRSNSTSRRWLSTRRSATGEMKATTWATWGMLTPNWGRRSGRSSTMSRRWLSTRRSATGEMKASGLATWGWPTRAGGAAAGDRVLEQALVIAREIGDRRNEGAWLGNLGLTYTELGETRRAIEYHEQALAIAREIGNQRGEGVHWVTWGMLTPNWGRRSGRSSTMSRRWLSTRRSATGEMKATGLATWG